MPALIGEQGAHIDGKVLLIGQRRQKRQSQPVIVCLLIEVCGQSVVRPQVVCYPVLGLVVGGGNILNNLPLSFSPSPTVLFIKVWVGIFLLLLTKEVIFFISIEIPKTGFGYIYRDS